MNHSIQRPIARRALLGTGATLAATPYPVDTAHPTSDASGAGRPAAAITCSARTTVAPANDATLA